jgi:hypothetical protein
MDRPVASAPARVHAFASAATPVASFARRWTRPPPPPRHPSTLLQARLPPVASFARRWTGPSPPPQHPSTLLQARLPPVASFARRWTRARRIRPDTRPRFCKRGYTRGQLRKKVDRPVASAPTPVHAFASAATPRSQLRKKMDPPAPVHAFASAATPRSQLRKKMDPPAASAPTPVHAFASAATPVASFARRWTRPPPPPRHPSTLLQARLPP